MPIETWDSSSLTYNSSTYTWQGVLVANRTFLGTVNSDFNTAANWDGGVSLPAASDNITISSNAVLDANETVTYGTVLIDASVTLNIATFNFQCGYMTINGTIQIDASAGTGLTCAGIDLGSTGVINCIGATNTSKINNSSDFLVTGTRTWLATNVRGIYTQTGSGNMIVSNTTGGAWHTYILNAGATLTATGTLYIGNTSNDAANTQNVTLNGTINLGTQTGGIAGIASWTFGANADITGTSVTYAFRLGGTCVVTWSRTTAITFSGTLLMRIFAGATRIVPAVNLGNAIVNIQVSGTLGTTATALLSSGTLTCRQFIQSTSGAGTVTIDNATNNPSFVVDGNVDLNSNASPVTLTYTKGTGTWTLGATSSNINFRGASVESVINAGTIGVTTKTLLSNFTTVNLTLTSGILNVDGYLVTGTGTFTGDTNGKLITNNVNGVIGASGNLTGFSGYTYNNGFIIENQATNTWDGTNFPSSANINYIMNGSTKTASLSTNYTVKSINMSAGAINSSVAGTQRTITRTNTGIFNGGSTVKDIAFNLRRSINAKTACTNLGNNKGIIFKDKVGMVGE